MEKVNSALSLNKNEAMSSFRIDQSAMMQNEEFAEEAKNPESSVNKDINPKDLNTSGGPDFNRESKIPQHKSNLLNKLDPRIGYTPEEVDESVAKYESKYGKPAEGSLKNREEAPGSKMSGFGADQSALGEMPEPTQDSEGHV